MTLEASCSALYFPEPPMDNILTLTWQWKESTAPTSYCSVIFKVKSSAPHLFYVLPRYGALLLSDASGNRCESRATQVVFGLRTASLTSAAAGAADALSEVAVSTLRRSSMSTGASRNYQERFAIEFFFVSSDSATYNRLAAALTADGRLTEVVRDVWRLAMSGTVQAVRGTPISLKAFTEGVTMDAAKKTDGGAVAVVVVPAAARLVPPSLEERAVSRASVPSARDEAVISAEESSLESGKSGMGELRALKLGIDALRHHSAAKLTHDNPSLRPAVSASVVPAATVVKGADINPARKYVCSDGASADITMSMPDAKDAISRGTRTGLPLFMVLAAMFGTYVMSMLMWRGGTRSDSFRG